MSQTQKLGVLRSSLSASEFSAHKAGGLSAVEVSLHAKLGMQTTMVQKQTALLAKACASDQTALAFLTNSNLPSNAEPAFAQFGSCVATLVKGVDHTVERALHEYSQVDQPAGALAFACYVDCAPSSCACAGKPGTCALRRTGMADISMSWLDRRKRSLKTLETSHFDFGASPCRPRGCAAGSH